MTDLLQRRVPFLSRQFGSAEDMNNVGLFAMGAADALGADLAGEGRAWAAFQVQEESSVAIRVTQGRAWIDGLFYAAPDQPSRVMNVQTLLPTGSRRIVTIVGSGSEIGAAPAQRRFLNEQTGLKEPQQVDTEIRRQLTLAAISGAEAAVPDRPFIDPAVVPIADLLLSPDGIETITLLTEYRLPSLLALGAAADRAEAFQDRIGTRIDTLASDLTSAVSRFGSLNAPALRGGLRRLTELEDRLGIDEGAQLTGIDRFLDLSGSDADNADFAARVEEGLRFPYAATTTARPQPLNPADPRLRLNSGWTLPAYREVRRLDVWGQSISVLMSQYTYQDTSFTIYPGAKRRRRFGPSMVVSGNSDFWQQSRSSLNYLTQTFRSGDETWRVTDEWIEDGVTYRRVSQFWDDQIRYWNGYRSISGSAPGYLVAQTMLNDQAGWLVSLGLRFHQVDPGAGVRAYICRAPDGEPDIGQIVSSGSIEQGVAVASTPGGEGNEVRLSVEPVFLDPGERYGVILVSTGSYSVACRTDNAMPDGTFFVGDGGGAWRADLGKDLSLRMYFAEFEAAYSTVPLEPMTLTGGITDFDVLSSEHVPSGAELYFMARVDGRWVRFEEAKGRHPLSNAASTLELQLAFLGTREVAPAMRLAQTEIRAMRSADRLEHISALREAGAAVSRVRVELELVAWDPAKHGLTATVEALGNADEPASVQDIALPDGAVRRVMEFDLSSPAASYRLRLVGTTTDHLDGFVVASRYDVASV